MSRRLRTAAIAQMPRGDLGAIQCLAAHVKKQQRMRHGIIEALQYTRTELLGEIVGAETLALQHEKCELLSGVKATQAGIELQTVDHTGNTARAVQENVLRAQISVAFHQTACSSAQQPRVIAYILSLESSDLFDPQPVDPQIRGDQIPLIARDAGADAA